MTGCILFILGVSKSYYSSKRWYIQGIEVMILATCATGAAYLVGLAFESV
jgi:VIT1/CCC1 family predicted Fe2+/Mn2+ transporter